MATSHLRLAVLEDHKITRLLRGAVADGETDSKVETLVHQRVCPGCRHWFWAWSTERRKCFVCDPPAREQLQVILGVIQKHGGAFVPALV